MSTGRFLHGFRNDFMSRTEKLPVDFPNQCDNTSNSKDYQMKMPIEDYLNSLTNEPIEHACIKLIFDECRIFMDFLCASYQVVCAERLLCLADSSTAVQASSYLNTITLSRGLLNHALTASFDNSFDQRSREIYDLSGESKYERIGGILWVVAHEFFHFARQHACIIKDHPEFANALEYDADCNAVAGLYRYYKKIYCDNPGFLDLKLMVLRSFFWPVRELIGTGDLVAGSPKKHPDWHLRLRYSIIKLIGLDAPLVNYGSTVEWQQEFSTLWSHVVECENSYLLSKRIGNVKKSNLFRNILVDIKETGDERMKLITRLWAQAESVVKQHSLLLSDMLSIGKSFLSISDHGMVFTQGGWSYTADGVFGVWRPVFHNRTGVEKILSYGNDRIQPNSYWVSISSLNII